MNLPNILIRSIELENEQFSTSSTVTPTITPKPSNFFKDHLPILIGIIIGCIVLVSITICICCCCRKRRSEKKNKRRNDRKQPSRKAIIQQIELQQIDERRATKKLKKQVKKSGKCDYMRLAREYRDSLEWNPILFDASQDKCYCEKCYPDSEPDIVLAAGMEYVIPRGWVRLGLYIDAAFEANHNIWEDWIVTFHGTSAVAAHSILVNRQFCLPGDALIDKSVLGIRPGHIPNKKHIYTSPTIAYSGLPVYSPSYSFHSETTEEDYEVQMVLQCRQKPGTFKVQGETIGAKSKRICPFIPNNKVEYYTEIRGSLVAYGLLIKIVE